MEDAFACGGPFAHSTAVPDGENSVEFLSFAVSEVKMAAEYLFESETGKQITFLDFVPPHGFSIKEGTFAVNLSALQLFYRCPFLAVSSK